MSETPLVYPDDIGEWIAHLDLHVTEHDERHAGLALRAAWPAVKRWFEQELAQQQYWKLQLDVRDLDLPAVRFYERDFYVLSNFSAFRIQWRGHFFDTSEAAYQWSKFDHDPISTAWSLSENIRIIRMQVLTAKSAHEAFKIAEANAHLRRVDWDSIKVNVMRNILVAKVQQHEYVRRKLLQTGDRELIEDSWRDDFWGWGPNRDGANMLGKLWMEIRSELKAKESANVRSN